MAGQTLKEYLAHRGLLGEAKAKPKVEPAEFGVTMGSRFNDSLVKHEKIFPDLREKLKKFIDTKKADPLNGKYGKHDGPFKSGTPLAGYSHCHLRDDAILIYTLKNRAINLLLICSHAEIDSQRKNRILNQLS